MRLSTLFVGLMAAVLMLAAPASAQVANVTQADIQRLQDNAFQAGNDIQTLRGRDATLANDLQDDLDDLREEVIYLKVKLRKESTLPRREYTDVRDRIEAVRTRARNEYTRLTAPPPVAPRQNAGTRQNGGTRTAAGSVVEVPVGTEIDVRLQNALNSGTTMIEDRFEATTLADVIINRQVVIPAGSVMRGVVTDVKQAGRINRTGSITVSFDQVTIDNRPYAMRGTVTQAIESGGIREDVGRGAAGGAVGAIIGGLLGGVKGAVLGAVIGGGGTIVATEGEQANLPAGATLRVRIDSPLEVNAAR
jgi:gas vesicle protein